MPARVIDAKNSTFIGTPAQILEAVRLLQGGERGTVVLDLKFARFVVLDKPLSDQQIAAAVKGSK